jgi:serine/threonine protein phosphatase 1
MAAARPRSGRRWRDGGALMAVWDGLRRAPRRQFRVPEGVRVYAVGDVHGRADLLRPMLGWIREDSERRGDAEVHVVFLGDLIDRGPDSAAVIEMLVAGEQAFGTRHFVRGNHEETLCAILDGDLTSAGDWIDFGGSATLQSYGVDESLYWHDPDAFGAALAAGVPATHAAFLAAMKDWVRIGDYLFVHAGIRPGVPLDEQDARDLRWIRGEFLDSRRDHAMMVVHGHTISENVEHRANRIGIDTGAYATGHLSVLALEDARRWTLTSRIGPR